MSDTTSLPSASEPAETATPWSVAAAAFAANFVTFGILFSFGVFLTPIAEDFGTTTGPVAALFSTAISTYYLGGAIGGRIGDRFGARPLVAAAALAMSLGLLGTAASGALWQTYAAFGVLVGLATGFCYPSMIGLIGRSFSEQRRPAAMGFLLAGVGAGTLVMPWLGHQLISAIGWRSTYALLAALALVTIGWAATRGDRVRTSGARLMRVGTLARSSRFLLFFAAVVAIGPGFYAPVAFYNDYAVDAGVAPGLAAGLVGISGATSVAARLACGALGNRIDPMWLCRAAFACLTGALAIWWISGGDVALLITSAVTHGVGWAVWVTATPSVLAGWYGVENLGGVIGIYYTGLGVGGLVGPAVCGFVIDAAGFGPAIGLVTVTSLIALALLALPLLGTSSAAGSNS
ncbi:MFS transporter [Candidatus Poriferisodalis sp.]|uniref:MFS transporter n=1 Tax=Candidatus Poriferisodalis sp. TaxID=3101277 RepID=UPI003B01FC09